MHRLFTNSKNMSDKTINIEDKSQVHYLKNVLRLRAGDNLEVFDDKANELSGLIHCLKIL